MIVLDKKIKHINNIDSDVSMNNDMDFVSWKVELNKGLYSFWELITEDIQE